MCTNGGVSPRRAQASFAQPATRAPERAVSALGGGDGIPGCRSGLKNTIMDDGYGGMAGARSATLRPLRGEPIELYPKATG
jgi:hypothetical protein